MKKAIKFITTMMIFMILAISSFAIIAPVNYTTTVDFTGPSSFILNMPGDQQRTVIWDLNTTPTDKTYSYTNYITLDETTVCGTVSVFVQNISTINSGLTRVLDVCSGLMTNLNSSSQYINEINALKQHIGDVEKDNFILNNTRDTYIKDLAKAENNTQYYVLELNKTKNELDGIKSIYNVDSSYKDMNSKCQTDLTNVKNEKQQSLIIGAIAGVIATILFRSKKKSSPSEMIEADSMNDDTGYD